MKIHKLPVDIGKVKITQQHESCVLYVLLDVVVERLHAMFASSRTAIAAAKIVV